MKFDMYFKNIKNMQFNIQIFKICNNVNLLSESNLKLQLSLQPNFSINFDPLNNILVPYKQTVSQKNKRSLQTKEKFQENFYQTKILKNM